MSKHIQEIVESRDYGKMVSLSEHPVPGEYVITGPQAGNLRGEGPGGWHRYLEYELVGTNSCHIFGFPQKPDLDTRPLKLKGGTLHAGDLVKSIKGPHKSAGFFQLDMLDGHALWYEGTYTNLQGTIVCFSQVSNGKVKALTSDRW